MTRLSFRDFATVLESIFKSGTNFLFATVFVSIFGLLRFGEYAELMLYALLINALMTSVLFEPIAKLRDLQLELRNYLIPLTKIFLLYFLAIFLLIKLFLLHWLGNVHINTILLTIISVSIVLSEFVRRLYLHSSMPNYLLISAIAKIFVILFLLVIERINLIVLNPQNFIIFIYATYIICDCFLYYFFSDLDIKHSGALRIDHVFKLLWTGVGWLPVIALLQWAAGNQLLIELANNEGHKSLGEIRICQMLFNFTILAYPVIEYSKIRLNSQLRQWSLIAILGLCCIIGLIVYTYGESLGVSLGAIGVMLLFSSAVVSIINVYYVKQLRTHGATFIILISYILLVVNVQVFGALIILKGGVTGVCFYLFLQAIFLLLMFHFKMKAVRRSISE